MKKELSVTVELLEHTLHRATARAIVRYGNESATAEATVDASDGSELTERLQRQGGLGQARLARVRATLLERAQDKAIHAARNELIQRTLTAEDNAALNRRGPLEPMAADLDAKVRDHHELIGAVETWKKSRAAGSSPAKSKTDA